MSGDFTSILTTALTILSIATLAGMGLLRGTVTNLREQLRDEREANTSHRQRIGDCELDNGRLRADLSALERVVTGEVHWVALGDQLTTLSDAAKGHWVVEIGLLSEIRDDLRKGR